MWKVPEVACARGVAVFFPRIPEGVPVLATLADP